jgi:hypothetical protein
VRACPRSPPPRRTPWGRFRRKRTADSRSTTNPAGRGGHADLPRRSCVFAYMRSHNFRGRGTGGHRSSSLGGRRDRRTDLRRRRRHHDDGPPSRHAASQWRRRSQGAHAGTPTQVRRTGRPARADTSPPAWAAPPAAASPATRLALSCRSVSTTKPLFFVATHPAVFAERTVFRDPPLPRSAVRNYRVATPPHDAGSGRRHGLPRLCS